MSKTAKKTKWNVLGQSVIALVFLTATAMAATHTVTNDSGGVGPGTLRTTVGDADGGDSVALTSSMNVITLSGTATSSKSNLIIKGIGTRDPSLPNVSGNKLHRIFDLEATTGTYTLSNLYLYQGNMIDDHSNNFLVPDASALGGAVRSNSSLQINGSHFSDNQSNAMGGHELLFPFHPVSVDAFGGAVYAEHGNITTQNSAFTSNQSNATAGTSDFNSADAKGGAIYANQGHVTATDTQFQANKANATGRNAKDSDSVLASGGTIYADSNVTVTEADFIGNETNATAGNNTLMETTANAFGGAISSQKGNVSTLDSAFTGNQVNATGGSTKGFHAYTNANGGAIYTEMGDVSMTETRFHENHVTAKGADAVFEPGASVGTIAFGGAVSSDGKVSANKNSTFTENQVTALGGDANMHNKTQADGGAIYSESKVTTDAATFTGNKSIAVGGDVHDFYGSNATNARGGAVSSSEGVAVTKSIFMHNLADAKGGNTSHPSAINQTDATGGAIYSDGRFTSTDSIFADNHVKATSGDSHSEEIHALGGAVYIDGHAAIHTINNSCFINNTATAHATGAQAVEANGGAIYVSGTSGTQVLELQASKDHFTIFKGNQSVENGVAKANAIHFCTTGHDANAILDIMPDFCGTVALFDPVSADLKDSGSVFTLNKNGAGNLLWNNENVFNAAGGSVVNLNQGKVTLMSEFTVKSEGHHDIDVNMSNMMCIRMELAHRDRDLAMFQNPTSFNVESGVHVDAIDYSFIPCAGEWLVTDKAVAGTDDRFIVDDSSGLYDACMFMVGSKLYIGLDNTRAIHGVSHHHDWNVRSDFRSGAFCDVFDRMCEQLCRHDCGMCERLCQHDCGILFRDFASNPQWFVPESTMSQGIIALDYATAMSRVLWMHERLSRRPGCHNVASQNRGIVYRASSHGCDVPSCDNRGSNCHSNCHSSCCSNCYTPYRLWGGYVGNNVRQRDTGEFYGYNASLNGGIVGLGYDLTPRLTLGLFTTIAKSYADFDALRSRIDTDYVQAGFYGSWQANRALAFQFDGSYVHYDNDSVRNNPYGCYVGSFNQDLLSIGATMTRDIWLTSCAKLTPYAGFRYQHLNQDDMYENDLNDLAAFVHGTYADSYASTFGASFSRDVLCGHSIMTPTLFAAWRHEFGDTQLSSYAGYYGTPITYIIDSVKRDRDSADIGLDLKTAWEDQTQRIWELRGGYSTNLTTAYYDQSFYATLSLRF